MKSCPMCGAYSEDPATKCVCGYVFKTGVGSGQAAESSVAKAVTPPTPIPGNGMSASGITLMLVGIGLLFWGLLMDISVETGGDTSLGVYLPRSDVANLSLMQMQQNLLTLRATAFIGGILLYVGGSVLKSMKRSSD